MNKTTGKIIYRVPRPKPQAKKERQCVWIHGDAAESLNFLMEKTGLTATAIVSEAVIYASENYEITYID